MRTSIFVIRDSLRSRGLAYCLYRGYSLWSIFVAWRLLKRQDQQYL
jgi:hypothetical protein